MKDELIFEVTGMHCTTVEIASTGIDPSAVHNAITSTGYTACPLIEQARRSW